MSEKVLYRKWRPLTFNEVVGQEHVTKLLQILLNINKQVMLTCLPGLEALEKQQWQEFWQKQSTA